MTRTDLHSVACSVARSVDLLGDAWSWLIVRDLCVGVTRFDQLHTDLGISGKVLSERLGDLVGYGIVTKVPYTLSPKRFEYKLSPMGIELAPVLAALVSWGDTWQPTDGGPPMRFHHVDCVDCVGSSVNVRCDACGEQVTGAQLAVKRT